MTSVALFPRDPRVHDNPVLSAAAETEQTVPLFVVDDAIAAAGYVRPNRARFLAECLGDLNAELRERGGRLVVRRGDVVDEMRAVAREVDAAQVHVAADVSGYAQHRREALTAATGASSSCTMRW